MGVNGFDVFGAIGNTVHGRIGIMQKGGEDLYVRVFNELINILPTV